MNKRQRYDQALSIKKKRDWISMVYPEDSSWSKRVKEMSPRQVCAIFNTMVMKIRGRTYKTELSEKEVADSKLITIFDIYNECGKDVSI